MNDMIKIGSRRELFADDFLIDQKLTDAVRSMHHPVCRERVLVNDAPWEGDGWVYYSTFEDNGLYRMYYHTNPLLDRENKKSFVGPHYICYACSLDGVHWVKPKLGIWEYNKSCANNIILEIDTEDAFHVFRDENPSCPDEERYKALLTRRVTRDGQRVSQLWCMTSFDGIHFADGWILSEQGRFDTHNTAFWDPLLGKYVCYFRDLHKNADGEMVRDIRRMESADFRQWSVPEPIVYTGCTEDFQMYTNGIHPYMRAPYLYVGIPTRYVQRPAWEDNYDELCGSEHRRFRMQFHPRYGLALTDNLLITSRDGITFNRSGEAFMRPGPEGRKRWVYGDSYASNTIVATPPVDETDAWELSFYSAVNQWSEETAHVYRYSLRMDGFYSYGGGYEEKTLVTKPFIFDGSRLEVNFSTSAAGRMRIFLEQADGRPILGGDSGDLFGDSIDRKVHFKAELSVLSGTPVRMRVLLKDADIYSFRFCKA